MSYRRLKIDTPTMGTYYSVVDDDYRPHELASRWLQTRYLTHAHAEATSAEYASSLALFLTWAGTRDLADVPGKLHLFVAVLAATPLNSGAHRGHPRSAGRINRIVVAAREFYRFGVEEGAFPEDALRQLVRARHVDGEGTSVSAARVRHRLRETRRAEPPSPATGEEIIALLQTARTARDRLLILLLALTGLRVGQALGLRRQDAHLVPDSTAYGLPVPSSVPRAEGLTERCRVRGEHLHIVRRRNPNGAWSKARFDFTVPVPPILMAHLEAYTLERDACLPAADNDMLIVALRGPTRGEAISARNVDKLFQRLSRAAGLRPIHPHMLRHYAASAHLAAGATHDELQALLGWAHPASAKPFVHVSPERRYTAVKHLEGVLLERVPLDGQA